ncbi:MAG TPA: hypothetical protein VD908_08115 [Cytophagales bacterium]|nr:hypothetical protein [Cytophagales bacterium]
MKKIIQITTIILLSVSCTNDEIVKRTEEDTCYLSEYTASNSESFTFRMENNKLVETGYGTNSSPTNFTYDDKGYIIKSEGPNFEEKYYYNSANKIVKSETYSYGVLVERREYLYDSDGNIRKYLASFNLDQQVQSYVEDHYEYKDENRVKTISYVYSSDNMNKADSVVINKKFDDKKNPYNTLNYSYSIYDKNNPIEITYSGDNSENNTVISYTYNENGYPITYETTYVNRTEYPVVTGEYKYTCP